jgi:hypothetical protein
MELIIIFLVLVVLLVLVFGVLGTGAASLVLFGAIIIFIFWCFGGFFEGVRKGWADEPPIL